MPGAGKGPEAQASAGALAGGSPHWTEVGSSAAATHPDLRWYIVPAYLGMEKAVERKLQEPTHRAGMQDKFGRILVPTEQVVEMKNGQRKTTERRLFPGYMLVEMVMD